MYNPSVYQAAVHEHTSKLAGHLTINAVAGGGKTRTLTEDSNKLPPGLNVIFLAFNKHIADTLRPKLPEGVEIRTYHSFSLMNYKRTVKNVRVDDNKERMLLEMILDKKTNGFLFPPTLQLIGLVKNTMNEDLDFLVEHYGVDTNGFQTKIFSAVEQVIAQSKAMLDIISFDDMIWLPNVLNMKFQKYDVMYIDELQDTNRCQKENVKRAIYKKTMVVGVGDENQSMYGFRGADIDAMSDFTESLKATRLPLSISYRSPQCIVDLVNRTFPEIAFFARDNAPDGILRTIEPNQFDREVAPGDMILCRCNAPLVRPCFRLIRSGIKAVIRGRDIGKNLQSLIKKFNCSDVDELLRMVAEYEQNEVYRLSSLGRESQAQQVEDKCETLLALADGCKTIADLDRRIDTIFSDEKESIVFSSVHKAKGLEAERVFILEPKLFNRFGKQDWERQQEKNIFYVALTRTLNELVFVER